MNVWIIVSAVLLVVAIIVFVVMAITIKGYHEKFSEMGKRNRQLVNRVTEIEQELNQAKKKIVAIQQNLDANIAEKRALEQKIKDKKKTVRVADGSEKRIAELQAELQKKEAELKEQSASVTEWQRTAEKWETQNRQTKQTLEQIIKDNEKAEDGSEKRIAELQEECAKLQQMLNIERGVSAMLKEQQSGSEQSREIERLRQQVQELVTEKLHLTKDAEQETEALRQQISSLQEQLAEKAAPVTPAPVPVTPAPVPVTPAPAPIPQEKRRIEEVLDTYLTVMDKAAEQELADRFRETAFILVDCSISDVVKVMRSPIIGTEVNKRVLRNQARRSNRVDIAESI